MNAVLFDFYSTRQLIWPLINSEEPVGKLLDSLSRLISVIILSSNTERKPAAATEAVFSVFLINYFSLIEVGIKKSRVNRKRNSTLRSSNNKKVSAHSSVYRRERRQYHELTFTSKWFEWLETKWILFILSMPVEVRLFF